jgi:hypothetical protein
VKPVRKQEVVTALREEEVMEGEAVEVLEVLEGVDVEDLGVLEAVEGKNLMTENQTCSCWLSKMLLRYHIVSE